MPTVEDNPEGAAALEAALAETRAALEAEKRARQAFVSLVTHELRGPMTAIKGYTDLLIKGITGPVNETQLGFLKTIRTNVERMSKLVSDLSDINKIEGQRLPITAAPVNVSLAVQTAVDVFCNALSDKDLALQVDVPGDVVALADQERLIQVLTNLLANAVQYTPAGGHITISAEETGDDRIRISVEDTGIGIPTEEQTRVFEMFFRASDEETRATSGNGLALHLSQQLLSLQDGAISFSSQRGQGSTFRIALPAAPGD